MWYVFYIDKRKPRITYELCPSLSGAFLKGKKWILNKTIESFCETENNLKRNLDVDIKDVEDCKIIFEQCEEPFECKVIDYEKGQKILARYKTKESVGNGRNESEKETQFKQ